ncbi:hypothetical protein GGR51DRAFT_559092 [Nemania sp. FL0031]|nr:hypothetical protein GGR51DRAFT_559092 [Nemania sp. FL0031]
MASSKKFPSFAKLPAELRIFIWEISILEHYHNRLVPMNMLAKTIICIRNLANSAHFRATWESRKVAMDLYPIRLPVLRITSPGYRVLEIDANNYQSHRVVYISADYDIFLLNPELLANFYFIENFSTGTPGLVFEALMWNSSSLSDLQCQRIRHIMLFNEILEPQAEAERHRSGPWVTIRGVPCIPTFWFDSTAYSGVQKCLYAMPDISVVSLSDMYVKLLGTTDCSIIEVLEQGGWLASLDREDIKRYFWGSENNTLENYIKPYGIERSFSMSDTTNNSDIEGGSGCMVALGDWGWFH